MPLMERLCTDANVARLEHEFAEHKDSQNPIWQQQRFNSLKLWRYRCYCYGYAAAEGDQQQRRIARSNFGLVQADNGDEGGGLGVLVKKPCGSFRKPRLVISTEEIVRAVMRVHREREHSEWRETWGAMAGDFYGIKLADVKWIVTRSQQYANNGNGSQTLPQSPLSLLASVPFTAVSSASRVSANPRPDPSDDESGAHDKTCAYDEILDALSSELSDMEAQTSPGASITSPAHLPPLSPSQVSPPLQSLPPSSVGGEPNVIGPEPPLTPPQSQAPPFIPRASTPAGRDDAGNAPTDDPSITEAEPAAPFERIQLAVFQILGMGSGSPFHRLVWVSDEASAFSALYAVKRLRAENVAIVAARWIDCHNRVPAVVRWPDSSGGSSELRRDLAELLRSSGVKAVTGEPAPSLPGRGGASLLSHRTSSAAASDMAADSDEPFTSQIVRLIQERMASYAKHDWTEALEGVAARLNHRSLSCLGGLTPFEVAFGGARPRHTERTSFGAVPSTPFRSPGATKATSTSCVQPPPPSASGSGGNQHGGCSLL